MGEPSWKRPRNDDVWAHPPEWDQGDVDDLALSQLDVLAEVDAKISERPQGTASLVREVAPVRTNHQRHLPPPSNLQPQPSQPTLKALQSKLTEQANLLQAKDAELRTQKGELTCLRYKLRDANKEADEIRKSFLEQSKLNQTQLDRLKKEKEKEVRVLRDTAKFAESDARAARHELSRLSNSTLNNSTLPISPEKPPPPPRQRRQTPTSNLPDRNSFYAPLGPVNPQRLNSTREGRATAKRDAEAQTATPLSSRGSRAQEEEAADGAVLSLTPFLHQPHLMAIALDRCLRPLEDPLRLPVEALSFRPQGIPALAESLRDWRANRLQRTTSTL